MSTWCRRCGVRTDHDDTHCEVRSLVAAVRALKADSHPRYDFTSILARLDALESAVAQLITKSDIARFEGRLDALEKLLADTGGRGDESSGPDEAPVQRRTGKKP